MAEATKRVLIIGGSGGLGGGAVEEHLGRGWRVDATVRDVDAGHPVEDRLSFEELDTTDWPAIDVLANRLEGAFDRLFVIAGDAGPGGPIGDVDPEAFARLMLVNTLAPLWIVDRLLGRVTARGMIAVMSSSRASLGLNTDGSKESYRISEAGLNMGLKSLSIRRADGRTNVAINPGWVRTAMGGEDATMTVAESMPRVVDTLDRHAGRAGMHYVDFDGSALAW